MKKIAALLLMIPFYASAQNLGEAMQSGSNFVDGIQRGRYENQYHSQELYRMQVENEYIRRNSEAQIHNLELQNKMLEKQLAEVEKREKRRERG